MEIERNKIYIAVFLISLLFLGSGVRYTLKNREEVEPEPVLRQIQLRDRVGTILTRDDVYIVDRKGYLWVPDSEGIANVPVGPITVFSAIDRKVLKVVDIPTMGASPYQVYINDFVKETSD